jgi:hypothetical protein
VAGQRPEEPSGERASQQSDLLRRGIFRLLRRALAAWDEASSPVRDDRDGASIA